MSQVKVIYHGLIKNKVDSHEDVIYISNGATVKELLYLLVERYGKEFRASLLASDWQLLPTTMIHLNDHDINEIDGLNTKLQDGSELCVTVMSYIIRGG